jgi:hypothetical protein
MIAERPLKASARYLESFALVDFSFLPGTTLKLSERPVLRRELRLAEASEAELRSWRTRGVPDTPGKSQLASGGIRANIVSYAFYMALITASRRKLRYGLPMEKLSRKFKAIFARILLTSSTLPASIPTVNTRRTAGFLHVANR